MKYIVMECHPAFAVVLDENGRFLKVANFHYEVGQTVTDVVEMNIPAESELEMWKKRPRRRWLLVLGAAVISILMLCGILFHMSTTPYASVYMTINPEIRVDVNRWDHVLAVEGLNEDGQKLVEDYDFSDESLEDVLEDLADRAVEMGYLKKDGRITLSLDGESYDWVVDHSEELRDTLEKHMGSGISVGLTTDGAGTQVPPAVPPENNPVDNGDANNAGTTAPYDDDDDEYDDDDDDEYDDDDDDEYDD